MKANHKMSPRLRCFAILLLGELATALASGPVIADPSRGGHPPFGRPPTYQATIADGRAGAAEFLQQTSATSVSIALMDGDQVVWAEGFGQADKASGAKPQPGTMYGMGSVSKTVAAVAAMRLVDQGKLALDAPVVRYLPDFAAASPEFRQITVRMLLNHSAGLPGDTQRGALTATYEPRYTSMTLASLRFRRLVHSPGLMSIYGNDNYNVLEALVASASGRPFADFVAAEVFGPLGMDHATFPTKEFVDGSYAKAYTGTTARRRMVVNAFASGGAYGAPTDVARLGAMLANDGVLAGRRLLSTEAVAAMAADQLAGTYDPVPSDAMRVGLGWDTVRQPGLAAVGVTGLAKNGDSPDYHATLVIVPGVRLSVAVMEAGDIDSEAVQALGERILLHALVEKRVIRHLPARLPAPLLPATPPGDAQLAAITGDYVGKGAAFRVVAAADRSLTVQSLGDADWVPRWTGLKRRSNGTWTSDQDPASAFRIVSAGSRVYLVLSLISGFGHYRVDFAVGQRIAVAAALSPLWSARMSGTWLVVNEHPDSVAFATLGRPPALRLRELPGRPGYIVAATPDSSMQLLDAGLDDTAAMSFFLSSRAMSLADLLVEDRDGEEWMWAGPYLYRPQATVPVLHMGANAIAFGTEGLAEWRSIGATATATIADVQAWRLFDAELRLLATGGASGSIAAPARSTLLLNGQAGSQGRVTLTSVP